MANAYSIYGSLALNSTPAAQEIDAIASAAGQRPGYSSPTPGNSSANSSGNNNTGGQLPHPFDKLGETPVIQTGVYYHLIPVSFGGSTHVPGITQYWFPVTGDSPVDFTFSHNWDEGDNLAKKLLNAVAGDKAQFVEMLAKPAQHVLGKGIYGSGCSVFNSSAPPSISVRTKLFSTGGNNLITMINTLYKDTHARLGQSAAGGVGAAIQAAGRAAGVQGGFPDHPGWWEVEVVSFAKGGSGGNKIVARMKDMFCVGMKVTMYSPWIGSEPSYMELSLDFKHGFPGLAESMDFGV